jgi:hypothetical protein
MEEISLAVGADGDDISVLPSTRIEVYVVDANRLQREVQRSAKCQARDI